MLQEQVFKKDWKSNTAKPWADMIYEGLIALLQNQSPTKFVSLNQQ